MRNLVLCFVIFFLAACAKGRIEPGAFVVTCPGSTGEHQVSGPANAVELPLE